MSAHANPDIIDDGLVFLYDTDDGKSYKGEPTTNLITSGGIDFSQRSGYTNLQTSQVVDSRSPSGYACEMEVQDGANINTAARSQFGQGTNMPSSGNAFVSIFAKLEGGTYSNITPKIYNGSGTAWQSLSALDGGSAYLTSEYRRFGYYGAITANPGFSMTKGNSNIQTGQKTRWHSPQVELKSHATPFVNGTRSATQGLIDRTGNTTIDLSNVSFDSNAQMTFDGTDDYIALPSDIRSIFTSYPNCMECVLKKSSSDQGDMVAFDVDITRWNLNYNMYVSNQWSFDFYDGTEHVIAAGNYDDEYVHFVLQQLSDGTMQIYANGVLKGSSAASNLSPNGSSIRIGSRSNGDSRYFKGDIPIMKIYNKALTSTEVLQNFNATKSRFGL